MSAVKLNSLSDLQLEKSVESVRARELETLSDMLNHLREIDRRRLYSKCGYRSLHDYAIRKLKYSEDQAHRRVSAARLTRDLPEVEKSIADGSLKLTHLTDAHTFFRKGEHTKDEKLAILKQLENTNKYEARKVLQREEVKARYSFEADKSLEDVVEELRGLHPHLNFDSLMQKICLLAYEKLSPTQKMKITESVQAEAGVVRAARNAQSPHSKTRYIPTNVRREVWINAQGKCQNCSSKFGLEYDHIIPFALGGKSLSNNLRLLCRSCNQRKAIESFGLVKMSKYLGPSSNRPPTASN